MVQGFRLCWEALHAAPLARRIDRIPNWTEDAFKLSDAELGRIIAPILGTSYHPAGSARMGRAADPGAVVDQYCRVHGIDNLRVVDASVMPTLMRANTNFPCMMLGERVADWMRAD